MKKGVIADVNGKKAILLSENGEFMEIKNNNYSVGQKVAVAKKANKKFLAVAASFFIVFIFGAGGFGAYYTPVGYVDIDINPSFRLEINVFDRVIKTVAVNDDARSVLEKTGKLSGAIDGCIKEIAKESKAMNFLNDENNDINITIKSENSNVVDLVKNTAYEISEHDAVVVTLQSNASEKEVMVSSSASEKKESGQKTLQEGKNEKQAEINDNGIHDKNKVDSKKKTDYNSDALVKDGVDENNKTETLKEKNPKAEVPQKDKGQNVPTQSADKSSENKGKSENKTETLKEKNPKAEVPQKDKGQNVPTQSADKSSENKGKSENKTETLKEKNPKAEVPQKDKGQNVPTQSADNSVKNHGKSKDK